MMMMRQSGSRVAGMAGLGSRLFSTTVIKGVHESSRIVKPSLLAREVVDTFVRARPAVAVFRVRQYSSTVTLQGETEKEKNKEEEQKKVQNVNTTADSEKEKGNIVSYWGVPPSKVANKDGTDWKWTCFRPWETYQADLSIDLNKHHVPITFLDKLAYWTVKSLRWPTDLFFQRRYGCRAMMLETVAAVPGMVGGMLLHCKSLRRFEHSGGWIKALLEEAENERMHLMTFMEVANPRWYERALVFTVQGVFFNAYFLGYMISPIRSSCAIAIDYWQLPAGSNLRDVVMVVRADEAHHRDVNHFASDIHYQGRELRESPAPVGYH
ncbi:ubiquinol oxidase 1a [Quercus suber]|uniref:Ubiquinol oxidase n=1 Tax=Quercus suber TaxID=58331 RepID=A0AAW0KKT0_QUESU